MQYEGNGHSFGVFGRAAVRRRGDRNTAKKLSANKAKELKGNGEPKEQRAEKLPLRAKLPNSRRPAKRPKGTEAVRPYGRMQEAEKPLGKWSFWLRQKIEQH